MKQTVEEAANDYLQKILEASDFEINFEEDNYDAGARDAVLDVTERAYITGAEWQANQSPWISVEERLPENTGWVFVAGGCYKYRVLFYCGGKFYTGKNLTTYDGGVLFWMPIPSFDQILEANKDVLQRMKEKGD